MKAKQPGESKRNESNKNNTSGRAADNVAASGGKALVPDGYPACQGNGKRRGSEKHEAGASRNESSSAPAGAGAVQAVQAGLGGDCGADSERARHAVCVPILPEVSSRSGAGKRIQEDAARAMGPLAPRGGIRNRWNAH